MLILDLVDRERMYFDYKLRSDICLVKVLEEKT